MVSDDIFDLPTQGPTPVYDDKTATDDGMLSGFMYVNFYNSENCGGSDESFSTGIALGVCLEGFDENGVSTNTWVKLSCNSFSGIGNYSTYSDATCETEVLFDSFEANICTLTNQLTYLMDYGQSYQVLCSESPDIVSRVNSLLFTGYDLSQGQCDGTAVDFYSYTLGQCYSANNLTSYRAECVLQWHVSCRDHV